MSGGYALVDDCNPAVYTLGDIAKVTEECFSNCFGTNGMYLPPQSFRKAWADYEEEPAGGSDGECGAERFLSLRLCTPARHFGAPGPPI
eukprot:1987518-Prymnesium_polylepis.1